jgi:outer membrane autotransporter protein
MVSAVDVVANVHGVPESGRIETVGSGVFVDGVEVKATPVDGKPVTVDASTPLDSYVVTNGGVLNVIGGGVVDAVYALRGTLNMSSGTVNTGIMLLNSVANIQSSIIRNASDQGMRIGTQVGVQDPKPTATLVSSNVSGVHAGIGLGVYGVLKVSDTHVYGASSASKLGRGIISAGGDLAILAGSHVVGEHNGLQIIDGSNGTDWLVNGAKSSVLVDGSTVEGIGGAAIKVDESFSGTLADITIQNNATLLSGNGNLLEVEDRSTANFSVNNSRLSGNLVADDTSVLNVKLENNAHLTGNIINSNTLAINSGASWTMLGDSSVKSLSMDGGRVSFGEGAFKRLTLNGLSGSGAFDMRINLDEREGDVLWVDGQASGNHQLQVRNTGVDAVEPDMEKLLLVHTEGGDAQFGLAGGRVDLGVYSYELEQQDNDWFIVGSGKVISPSTQSVLALFNAAPTIWNSELSTLRSRMGEVRGKELGGGWIRAYGGRFNASTSDGVDYRQKQSGLSLGADAPLAVANGQLKLGVMAGYSKNDLNLDRGTAGNVDSFYVGGYGTWLLEDGFYLDGVLKLNRFRNESKVAMSDGAKAKGDYDSTGIGGSLEFGKHIGFADGYFLEPFAQLSSVWVKGADYRLDNGMRARNDNTQSVLGKVGTSAGRSIALKDGGVLQPYVRVAVAQEFSRSNEVKVNNARFDNNLFGSRAEVGTGVSVSLSERLQVHADFDYMKGKHVEQPWGANVGLKLSF